MPEIVTAEEALKDLAPVLPAIWDALEAGTQGAREFFEIKGAPIEPHHASSTVRWEAKRRLTGHGHDISSVEYDVEHLALNGLRLKVRNGVREYLIWILKSDNGGLPVPGPSPIRRAFFSQQLILPMAPFIEDAREDEEQARIVNVVVLWDVTREYRIKELFLVCPKAGDTTRASVQVHWGPVPIPHSAYSIEGESPNDDVDDLDISKDQSDDESS